MDGLRAGLERAIAEHGFTGAVRVDRAGLPEVALAHGVADRAFGIPNTVDTQFGVASAAKAVTALAVVSLIAEGRLELATPVRTLLGDDLPDVDDAVTVEHLLAHRSGRIVPPAWVEEMVRPRSDVPRERRRYGLGFWLHESTDAVLLEGYDAGVSFWSVHDPGRAVTWTVMSNTSEGAWPVVRHLRSALGA